MKIEHKLKPEVAEVAKSVLRELTERRRKQLMLLGEASELNQQIVAANNALEALIATVARMDELPPTAQQPYVISQDGTAIIGEAVDEKK
jgi:hypothetical protein